MTAHKTAADTHRKTTKSAGRPKGARSGTPAYQRVADHVQQLVSQGQMPAGSMLPSERNLADQFGVCHLTVRKGLAMLVDQGLIQRQVGQGTFVADATKPAVQASATQTQGSMASASSQGNAIALCVIECKSEMPTMGYAINGVRSVFDAHDFPLEIIGFPEGGCTESFWKMVGDRVQGLIVQGYLSASDIASLNEKGMKYVSVGFQIGQKDAPWVYIDFEDMLDRIMREAYRFGHQSVGLVGWGDQKSQRAPDHATPPTDIAYRRACHRFNLGDSADRIYHLPEVEWPDASLVDTRRMLEVIDDLPSLLIVTDEVMATALQRDFEAKGLRIPQDLSIVCLLDSTPNAHRLPLTAVDARREYMAIYQKAAGLLLSQINDEPLAQVQVPHQCQVHFKASLAPASEKKTGK